MSQQIVINACFGGFGLSYDGMMAYAKKKGIKLYAFVDKRGKNGKRESFESYKNQKDPFTIHYSTTPLKNGKYDPDSYFRDDDIKRDDPDLVAVVKELKEKANGNCAELKIITIPDGVKWEIDEYDGNEHAQECCQKWS